MSNFFQLLTILSFFFTGSTKLPPSHVKVQQQESESNSLAQQQRILL